jgi:hypothetical protein
VSSTEPKRRSWISALLLTPVVLLPVWVLQALPIVPLAFAIRALLHERWLEAGLLIAAAVVAFRVRFEIARRFARWADARKARKQAESEAVRTTIPIDGSSDQSFRSKNAD